MPNYTREELTPEMRWAEIKAFHSPEQIIEDYKKHAGWARQISSNPQDTRNEEWLINAINTLIQSEITKSNLQLLDEFNKQIDIDEDYQNTDSLLEFIEAKRKAIKELTNAYTTRR